MLGSGDTQDSVKPTTITRKSVIRFLRTAQQKAYTINDNKCLRCVSLAINIATGQMEIQITEGAPWNAMWPALPAAEFTSMRVEQKQDLKRSKHHYVTSVYVNGKNEFSTGHTDSTTTDDDSVHTQLWLAFPTINEDREKALKPWTETVIKEVDFKSLNILKEDNTD